MIELLRESGCYKLFIVNVTGTEDCVCTKQLTYSVGFQAPHLLYTPLLHGYDYCYLRYISANYITIA